MFLHAWHFYLSFIGPLSDCITTVEIRLLLLISITQLTAFVKQVLPNQKKMLCWHAVSNDNNSLMQLPSALIILMMVQLSDNRIPQGPYTVNPHSCRVLSRLILLFPALLKTTLYYYISISNHHSEHELNIHTVKMLKGNGKYF